MDLCYLDNNATTKPAAEVVDAMLPYLTEWFGNASSVYRFGQRCRQAVDEARGQVADLIHCGEGELIFTGGGTESVNTAVRGLLAGRDPRKRLVTCTVEHSAGRELAKQLGREGFEIVEIPVARDGTFDLDTFRSTVDDTAAAVSVMWANNETGVLHPVAEIAAHCRAAGVPFHCDATQAIGKIPVDVRAVPVDAMSFAAHKFHGPKGVGGLYVRRGLRVRPLLIGGSQERGRRGGTENVPGIVGMGVAAELAGQSLSKIDAIGRKRDRFERAILSQIPDSHVIGRTDLRVTNTTNIAFARLEAEAILLLLSEQNICASAGSACASGSLEPSPVLQAMKIDPKIAHGAVRFSLSRYTTDEELDYAIEVLPSVIDRLRAVMPVEV
jgi:cysteine desulfurase